MRRRGISAYVQDLSTYMYSITETCAQILSLACSYSVLGPPSLLAFLQRDAAHVRSSLASLVATLPLGNPNPRVATLHSNLASMFRLLRVGVHFCTSVVALARSLVHVVVHTSP